MFADTLHDFKVALLFLTRVPVRLSGTWHGDQLAAAVPMFPVVGALVGAVAALGFVVAQGLGLPPFLAAVVALAVQIGITGGLHEDGLADVADGFGGGRSRADKLRIMRDSRLGSFGAIALTLTLLTRIGALTELAQPGLVAAVLITNGAVSRALVVAAMAALDPARSDGAAATAGRPHLLRTAAAGAIALLLALILLPPLVAGIGVVTAAFAGMAVVALAQRQIGGITGDVLGGIQQVAEIGLLLAVVAVLA